jgi:seryl-tRNA synthetase
MTSLDFHDELVAAGVLVDGGVAGLYHRSFGFEQVVRGVSAAVTAAGEGVATHRLHLGPLEARTTREDSGYLTSFPNLVGVVSSYDGTESEVPRFLESVEAGVPWLDAFRATDVALCSAGCHPVYPLFAGDALPDGGVDVEVETWCFRHEPSDDPARMQQFRQHEFVHLGTEDAAVAHRDRWLERGRALLGDLGLDVAVEVANDPFFGRAGRLLAANQRTKELKFELVAPISSERPGAIASANYHEDHFGVAFHIDRRGGGPAHTACIGFGLERIALALHLRHGLRVGDWPAGLRTRLSLEDGGDR